MSYWRFHRSLITIKCSCEVTNAFTPQLTILVGIINSLFNCIPLSYLTKIFCCSKIFCCFSPSNLADAINNELRNRESWCQKYSITKDQIWTKFMSTQKFIGNRQRKENEFKYSDLPMQYGDDRTVVCPGVTGLY